MADWFATFDAVFFLTAGTVVCGGLGVLLSYCFKSKCAEFALCSSHGCIYLRRDVEAENAETKMELDHIPMHTAGTRTPTPGDWGGSVV